MPRLKVTSPARNKHRPPVKAHSTPVKVPFEQSVPIVKLPVERPVTPSQQTRKRVVWRPKYHETARFLERESFKGLSPMDKLPSVTIGEAYRVASSIFQAAQQASLETRPVSWGYGYTDGALGHENTRRVVELKQLTVFRRSIIRAVSAGNRLSLFLTDDNRIFQSGRLFMKQDGCAMWKPVEISMEEVIFSPRIPFVAIEAGHLAAYALDDQGRLYSWGSHIFGQLGHKEEELSISEDYDDKIDTIEDADNSEEEDVELPPKTVIVERTPRLVEELAGHSIVKISAGNHFAVAVSTTGEVFSWGQGCFGQLGNGILANVSSPARIEALKDYIAIDIAAGMSHVLGVFIPKQELNHESSSTMQQEEDLSIQQIIVLVWGRGKHGCLGLGGANNELFPRENTFFRGLGATKVSAGSDHSLVLCSVGAQTFLYSFGGNQFGQLGIASNSNHVDMPSFLDEFSNVHIADIGAGAQYSAALTGDGEVYTWGDAQYGQTGRSDRRTTFVPWQVDLPSNIPSTSFFTQLSIGSHHALAQLRIHGQVDRWRNFPLGGIVQALNHQEKSDKVFTCKSSQTTTKSVLGIFVQCETCGISPLCRVCCRRCHVGHVFVPIAIGRRIYSACKCLERTFNTGNACIFSKKLPSAIAEED